jgi:putative ABC transport system permease protein
MPTSLRQFWARLSAFWHARELDSDFKEEIESHLAMLVEDNVRRGLSIDEARRRARIRFGGATVLEEQHRAVRGLPFLDAAWLDLRFAFRSLAAAPQFTAVAFLTIVLTISAISTVFTVVAAVLLTPLPFPDSDRFVTIRQRDLAGPAWSTAVSPVDLADVRANAHTLEAVAAYADGLYFLDLNPDSNPYRTLQWFVTSDFFSMLSIHPIRGRGLEPRDDYSDAPTVAVIGYDVWTTQFARREDIVGQPLRVPIAGGRSLDFIIVGVMPPAFEPPVRPAIDLPGIWTPLPRRMFDRRGRSLAVIGKLRQGVSVAMARKELDAIGRHLAEAYPDTNRDRTFVVVSLLDQIVGDTKRVLWIFFGAVSCVLLIGMANLISLQIARNAAREQEFTICAALGGGRGRLVRQQLVETTLVSLAGGLVGTLLTSSAVKLVVSALPARFPRADQIAVGPAVLIFTFGLSLTVGIVFGLIPAWRVSRPDLTTVIKEATRSATMSVRRSRLQRSLIAVETALALMLLVGAALLTNSFWRLFAVDAGMTDEERLWSVGVTLPRVYQPIERSNAFFRSALSLIRTLPQVESAAATKIPPPLSSAGSGMSVMADGRNGDPGRDAVKVSDRPVSADYFKTLGISVTAGRPIVESDGPTSERVAVLNEAAAHLLWPSEDPVGKRFSEVTGTSRISYTVVGIIPDFRQRRLTDEPSPQLYRSYEQDSETRGPQGWIMVRVKPEAGGFASALRSALVSLEPKAIVHQQTIAALRWMQIAADRFRTGVLLSFALAATFLALVGIFGLVSYTVVQRSREIGVRIALGAQPADIRRLVVRHALMPTTFGLVAGLVGAVAASRFVASFLFEMTATDPATYATAVVGLFLSALAASVVPARKATHVDPMVALRCE